MPCPENFQQALTAFGVPAETAARIGEGYENLVSSSPKQLKAAYFRRAVELLLESPGPGMLRPLLESCACCKGGAREKASKAFAKAYSGKTLAEKLALIPSVPNMGRPELCSDGSLVVHAVSWQENGLHQCACPNFSRLKRDYAVPREYCYCCAGHFKHHYQIMLGVKLETTEIVSSPLDTGGAQPCVIRFRILP